MVPEAEAAEKKVPEGRAWGRGGPLGSHLECGGAGGRQALAEPHNCFLSLSPPPMQVSSLLLTCSLFTESPGIPV